VKIMKILQFKPFVMPLRWRSFEDSVGDKKRWITTETGSHVQLDEQGNIIAGMGGKFNGKNIKDIHGTKKFTKHETNKETGYRHDEEKSKKYHETIDTHAQNVYDAVKEYGENSPETQEALNNAIAGVYDETDSGYAERDLKAQVNRLMDSGESESNQPHPNNSTPEAENNSSNSLIKPDNRVLMPSTSQVETGKSGDKTMKSMTEKQLVSEMKNWDNVQNEGTQEGYNPYREELQSRSNASSAPAPSAKMNEGVEYDMWGEPVNMTGDVSEAEKLKNFFDANERDITRLSDVKNREYNYKVPKNAPTKLAGYELKGGKIGEKDGKKALVFPQKGGSPIYVIIDGKPDLQESMANRDKLIESTIDTITQKHATDTAIKNTINALLNA